MVERAAKVAGNAAGHRCVEVAVGNLLFVPVYLGPPFVNDSLLTGEALEQFNVRRKPAYNFERNGEKMSVELNAESLI